MRLSSLYLTLINISLSSCITICQNSWPIQFVTKTFSRLYITHVDMLPILQNIRQHCDIHEQESVTLIIELLLYLD